MNIFLPFANEENSITGDNRRSYLVYALCRIWVIILTALFSIRVLLNHDFLVHDSAILAAVFLAFSVTLFVNKKGYSLAAAYMFLGTCITITSIAALVSGGVTTPAMMTYPPTIFAAGILLGKRGGVTTAIIAVLVSSVILALQVNQLLPVTPLFKNPVSYWLGFLAAALVMSVLQYIVNHQNSMAMEKLRESELKFRNIFENAINVFFRTALDGTILEVSPSIQEHLGYNREELLGTSVASYYYDPAQREAFIRDLKERKTLKEYEIKFRAKDGEFVYISASVRLIFAEDGSPMHIDGVFNNITERKLAEIKLKQSEEKHRALTENLTDEIMLFDETGKIVYQSPAVGRTSGFSPGEIKDKGIFDFIHPDDLQDTIEIFEKARSLPGVPLHSQCRVLHTEGHYVWLKGTITNLLENESVKAYIVNYHNITERVQYLNDIEEQNRKLREIAWIQSHVVRAPLARMMGLVHVLRETEMSSVEFEKWVGYFNITADELDEIVHDISVKAHDIPVEQ